MQTANLSTKCCLLTGPQMSSKACISDAVRAGVRIEAIEALRAKRDELLSDDELLLATYIRQLVDGKVEQPIYDRMYKRLGARGIVEYSGFILWLQWIMRMMQALSTGSISDAEVDNLIVKARAIADEKRKPT